MSRRARRFWRQEIGGAPYWLLSAAAIVLLGLVAWVWVAMPDEPNASVPDGSASRGAVIEVISAPLG